MKNIFAIVTTLISIAVVAQENPTKPLAKVKFSEVNIRVGSGYNYNNYNNVSYDDLKSLVPESNIFDNPSENLVDVMPWGYFYYSNNVSDIGASIGLQFLNKEKTAYRQNPLIKIGVNYTTSYNSIGSLRFEEKIATDTLISNNTTNVYTIDYMEEVYYNIDIIQTHLQLDLSLIYRTSQKNLVSFYSGIGFNLGLPITSQVSVFELNENFNMIKEHNSGTEWKEHNSGTEWKEDNSYYEWKESYYSDVERTQQKFEIKKQVSQTIYMPIGVSSKFSKSKPFWSKTGVFVELRPSLTFMSVPELNQTNIYRGLYRSLGFRVLL